MPYDPLQLASDNIEHRRKGEARLRFITPGGELLRGAEITLTQQSQDFLFGNLIFDLVWSDPAYKPELFKQRFLELFNYAIFPFYWPFYERVPGREEWQRLLPAVEWCRANGVTPKGHPLVWPYSAGVPEWLYDIPEGSVQPLTQARVLSIVRGFAPHIQVWDVTNEAVNHISWREATQPTFRTRYHEVGTWRGTPVSGAFKRQIPLDEAADWVEDAFRWAYSANPRATLILNDYEQESDPVVRRRFYDLAKELVRRGVPLSGLGLQWHPVNLWLSPQQVWETLEMYADLGIPLHITELHQPSWEQEIEGDYRHGEWTAEAQAEYLSELYRLFFGHPAVVSINYWGFSDRGSWMERGGLVDAEYQPKPAFTALKQLIKGEWLTPVLTRHTDADGEVRFGGFFGEYEAVLSQPGARHCVYRFHLSAEEENRRVFTVERI